MTQPLSLEEAGGDSSKLPGWHPDHCCGMYCDGQDGTNSNCAIARRNGPPPGTPNGLYQQWLAQRDKELGRTLDEITQRNEELGKTLGEMVETQQETSLTTARYAMVIATALDKIPGIEWWLTAVGHHDGDVVIYFNDIPPDDIVDKFGSEYEGVSIVWSFMSKHPLPRKPGTSNGSEAEPSA